MSMPHNEVLSMRASDKSLYSLRTAQKEQSYEIRITKVGE